MSRIHPNRPTTVAALANRTLEEIERRCDKAIAHADRESEKRTRTATVSTRGEEDGKAAQAAWWTAAEHSFSLATEMSMQNRALQTIAHPPRGFTPPTMSERLIVSTILRTGHELSSARGMRTLQEHALKQLGQGVPGPVGAALGAVGAALSRAVSRLAHDMGADRPHDGGEKVASAFLQQIIASGSEAEAQTAQAVVDLSKNFPEIEPQVRCAQAGLDRIAKGDTPDSIVASMALCILDDTQGHDDFYAFSKRERGQKVLTEDAYDVVRDAMGILNKEGHGNVPELARTALDRTSDLGPVEGRSILKEALIAIRAELNPTPSSNIQ